MRGGEKEEIKKTGILDLFWLPPVCMFGAGGQERGVGSVGIVDSL